LRLSEPYRRNRLKTNRITPGAILLIPLLLISASIASAQAVGEVRTYAGDVRLERAARPVAVATGLAVLRGDRFTTGANGRLIIVLNDQSSLDLYESSVLVLNDQVLGPNGQASTQVSVFSGILRSIVHVTSGGPTPNFEVHTPNAIAAARGTDFDAGYHQNVHRSGFENCVNFTDVFTREGKVQVTGLGKPGESVLLNANQSTTVACGQAPAPVSVGMGALALYATGAAAALEGAIIGGYAGAGGFSNPNSKPKKKSPDR
jgi:hypothetical protein